MVKRNAVYDQCGVLKKKGVSAPSTQKEMQNEAKKSARIHVNKGRAFNVACHACAACSRASHEEQWPRFPQEGCSF